MKKYFYFSMFIGIFALCLCAPLWAAWVYEYDANGNLIKGDGKYFEYNDANKLVRVRQGDADGAVIAEYLYDHSGQRIKKTENSVTTYYIGKHYEEEYAGGEQTGKTSYYFANGQRVAKKDSSGKLSFFHSDHLGGTNAITDSAGNLVERTKYYPFGDIREGGNERYTFTGKEKDKATDFYYFEARYYNPGFRHFTQADVVISSNYNPQSLNRYAYVQNNPFRYIDPFGYSEVEKNTNSIWWKQQPWYTLFNNNDENVKQSTDETSLTTDKKMCVKPEFLSPLETMEKGGYDWGGKGLKGVSYSGKAHWGIDLSAKTDTPVKAPANGKITFAGKVKIKTEKGPASFYQITFCDEYGFEHIFIHMKKFDTYPYENSLTEAVAIAPVPFDKGSTLGFVGPRYPEEVNVSTNPHLHYTIKYQGKYLNPNDFFDIKK